MNKKIVTDIISLVVVLIPILMIALLEDTFSHNYSLIIVILLSLAVFGLSYDFASQGFKTPDKQTFGEIGRSKQVATLLFSLLVSLSYSSLIFIAFEAFLNQQWETSTSLVMINIVFLLIYPLIEFYSLTDPDTEWVLYGQEILKKIARNTNELIARGNQWMAKYSRAISASALYFLFIWVPIGLLSLFNGFLTSISLWSLVWPLMYLGLIAGLSGAQDLLLFRLLRPTKINDWKNLGIVHIDRDTHLLEIPELKINKRISTQKRIIPKINFGYVIILLFAFQIILATSYEIITVSRILITGTKVLGTAGLFLVVQTLINKGRGALKRTLDTSKAVSLRGKGTALALPAFLGIALFTNIIFETTAVVHPEDYRFMIFTGLDTHLGILRAILVLESLTIIITMLISLIAPMKDLRKNLIYDATKLAREGNFMPLNQLLLFNSKYARFANMRTAIKVRKEAIFSIKYLMQGKTGILPPKFVRDPLFWHAKSDNEELRDAAIIVIDSLLDLPQFKEINDLSFIEDDLLSSFISSLTSKDYSTRSHALSTIDQVLEYQPESLHYMVKTIQKLFEEEDENIQKTVLRAWQHMIGFNKIYSVIEGEELDAISNDLYQNAMDIYASQDSRDLYQEAWKEMQVPDKIEVPEVAQISEIFDKGSIEAKMEEVFRLRMNFRFTGEKEKLESMDLLLSLIEKENHSRLRYSGIGGMTSIIDYIPLEHFAEKANRLVDLLIKLLQTDDNPYIQTIIVKTLGNVLSHESFVREETGEEINNKVILTVVSVARTSSNPFSKYRAMDTLNAIIPYSSDESLQKTLLEVISIITEFMQEDNSYLRSIAITSWANLQNTLRKSLGDQIELFYSKEIIQSMLDIAENDENHITQSICIRRLPLLAAYNKELITHIYQIFSTLMYNERFQLVANSILHAIEQLEFEKLDKYASKFIGLAVQITQESEEELIRKLGIDILKEYVYPKIYFYVSYRNLVIALLELALDESSLIRNVLVNSFRSLYSVLQVNSDEKTLNEYSETLLVPIVRLYPSASSESQIALMKILNIIVPYLEEKSLIWLDKNLEILSQLSNRKIITRYSVSISDEIAALLGRSKRTKRKQSVEAVSSEELQSIYISGDMLRMYIDDAFGLWAKYHAPRSERDPDSEYQESVFQTGILHEEHVVKQIYKGTVVINYRHEKQGINLSTLLMKQGTQYISNVPVIFEDLFIKGKIDLMVRDDSHGSKFGDYHYVVKEIKVAKNIKPGSVLQGAFYNYLLGEIQGYTPEKFYIINRDYEEKEYKFTEKLEKQVKGMIDEVRMIVAGHKRIDPGFNSTGWPWKDYANKIAIKNKDVSLIAGLGYNKAVELKKKGYATYMDLVDIKAADLVSIKGIGEKMAKSFIVKAKALTSNEIIIQDKKLLELPEHEVELFLDFEAAEDPSGRLGIVNYLTGLVERKEGKETFHAFIAQTFDDEKKMLMEFLRYLENFEDVIIYHYHRYERIHFNKMFEKHGIEQKYIDKVNDALFDLHKVVEKGCVFPTHNNSLKTIAKHYGFNWRHKEVDAMESAAYYIDYVQTRDLDKLQKAIDYNEDDCWATMIIKDKLGELAKK